MNRDARFMSMAVAMGQRGLGLTWPNPSVGCVIARDNRVLARSVTAPGGRPHAEPQALAQAGAAARGADVYVTLEPCSHHGQTGPCAEALIKAGVARVVIALQDPDPRVSGRGIAMLQKAGIETVVGVEAEAAHRLTEGFLTRIILKRPHLTLKLANSLDGRIATATGESRWITGPTARAMVHRMRATSDAVLIGSGTAFADDPMLDVRPTGPKPVRIVVDRNLRLSLTSRLATTAKEHPLWLVHSTEESKPHLDAGAVLLPCPQSGNRVDLSAMMKVLAERGLTRVFCEGGGTLAASLIESGLVDQLVTFTAGVALGAEGVPSLAALTYPKLASAPRFSLHSTKAIGADTVAFWRPN